MSRKHQPVDPMMRSTPSVSSPSNAPLFGTQHAAARSRQPQIRLR